MRGKLLKILEIYKKKGGMENEESINYNSIVIVLATVTIAFVPWYFCQSYRNNKGNYRRAVLLSRNY